MDVNKIDLDIIFRMTMPELVLRSVRDCYTKEEGRSYVGPRDYAEYIYQHFATMKYFNYSIDEIGMRYQEMNSQQGQKGIFGLLVSYADEVLDIRNSQPVCCIERILNWNTVSLSIDQNLVVSAWLAARNNRLDNKFTWSTILKTDDKRLEQLCAGGLAENHFHLHGSTQSFALSWASLMNHPKHIRKSVNKYGDFSENYNAYFYINKDDSQMQWAERLLYAAQIRVLLFESSLRNLNSGQMEEKYFEFADWEMAEYVETQVQRLRMMYGARFAQPDGFSKCLDYANCSQLYQVDCEKHNRLIAGERSLLYHCFLRYFRGEMADQEERLLYAYILIKNQFRGEIIQNNGRTGFGNFSRYQDRKNQLFENWPEYWAETLRLSVCRERDENNAISIEARIMPKDTSVKMESEIRQLDKLIEFASKDGQRKPFYVIHFPKIRFDWNEISNNCVRVYPRNKKAREMASKKARSLNLYAQHIDWKCQRVWGIDACSAEIGCRPECFATEFRYLRSETKKAKFNSWVEYTEYYDWGVTYHVGEDFLDIVDGLRAIDETVFYLELRKGDRLGHAMALGIKPEEYYEFKQWNIVLTKQDRLDNLVWMLMRSLDWNIIIDANHRAKMENEVRRLMVEIYGKQYRTDMYYQAWKLRGDHPDLYRKGKYVSVNDFFYDTYEKYKIGKEYLDDLRNNEDIAHIYFRYHYDDDVKRKGLETIAYTVDTWYIEIIHAFQLAIQKIVKEKGLAIECNPTSNVLIGTFHFYDHHPILSFNDHILHQNESSFQIPVSINTDDIGVFDTSLDHEYALLFSAIARNRHAEGNYQDQQIYEFLDYIRQLGLEMSFCPQNHLLCVKKL